MKTKKIRFVSRDKSQFFAVLKERVDNYFTENNISPYANKTMVFKTIFMLSLYFVPYALIMSNFMNLAGFYICWALMGFGLAGIGMSVMHDANHGAYSENAFINKMLGLTLTFVGGDTGNWKTQHNILHHTYTNIHGHDRDIDNKVIMRFCPAGKYKKIQRFQVFYVFVFYSIMTLYWTTIKDFLQHFELIRQGHNRENRKERNLALMKIIFWKIIYIT